MARASVSKTECCRFESYQACGNNNKMVGKIQKFFSEVVIELKKVNWPTRPELIEATWVVLVSTFFLGLFIGSSDFILSRLLGLIIK